MIPDPATLAANLGVGTLVLIVGGQRTFLVAVTGSPETKTRMIDAYRKAGLPVQIAVGSRRAVAPQTSISPDGDFQTIHATPSRRSA
jgi:hypothetical protein